MGKKETKELIEPQCPAQVTHKSRVAFVCAALLKAQAK
jgi:hypothetical protein